MKMIKSLGIIAGLILALFLMPGVLAIDQNVAKDTNGGHLIITNVDAKVDGKSSNDLEDGDQIRRDAKPGSTVKLEFRVGNNFTREDDEVTDVEIKDVVLNVYVDFDYDEIDEDSKEFDIRYDDTEKVSIQFDVPLEVDEDTFTISIEAEGDTDDNGTQRVEMELDLEVNKDRHDVEFTKNALIPSEIKCSRSVQLTSTVINLGEDDEDGVILEVSSPGLGISKKETFDLSSDPDDDNYDETKSFTFLIPDDTQPGIYTVQSRVVYNDGGDEKTETADLTVQKCEVTEEPEVECETDDDCKSYEMCNDDGECVLAEEEVVVVQPPVTEEEAEPVVTPPTPVTEEESFFETSGFLVILIAGEILLLVVAVLIVVAVFRKRG